MNLESHHELSKIVDLQMALLQQWDMQESMIMVYTWHILS